MYSEFFYILCRIKSWNAASLRSNLSLFPKIEKLFRGYIQRGTNIKYNIKRYGAVSNFNTAHMCSANVDQLGKPHLGKTSFLAVVSDV